jgi:hypothetical protein
VNVNMVLLFSAGTCKIDVTCVVQDVLLVVHVSLVNVNMMLILPYAVLLI